MNLATQIQGFNSPVSSPTTWDEKTTKLLQACVDLYAILLQPDRVYSLQEFAAEIERVYGNHQLATCKILNSLSGTVFLNVFGKAFLKALKENTYERFTN